MEETLLVSQIERCAVRDGPGIRTVVFLQGCPLHCLWCCNPETQSLSPVWMQDEALCRRCGECVGACPHGALKMTENGVLPGESCIACGACAALCPAGAIRYSSRKMSVEEVLREVLRDKDFYQETGGGLTVSGGEPLLQKNVLTLLRRAGEEGLNVYVETTAHVGRERLEAALPFVDGWYIDYKHPDAQTLRQWTGADKALIESGIRFLRERGAQVTLRTPVIPGFNDSPEILERCYAFARSVGVESYILLPYHELGRKKYRMLRMDYSLRNARTLTEADLRSLQELGAKMSLSVSVG